MIKVVLTAVRPNVNVPFLARPGPVNEFLEQQKAQGKFITESRNLSEDGLIFTYEGVWNSAADYKEFRENPVVVAYGNERSQYNTENGITTEAQYFDYMN